MTRINPTPWVYDPEYGEIRPEGVPSTRIQCETGAVSSLVAETVSPTDGPLLAAAPELRAALEMALKEWEWRLPGCADPECGACKRRTLQRAQVQAALAKARG